MTDREWSKLCRSIHERKCILMIGPEFQIEIQDPDGTRRTTFSELLAKKVADEILAEDPDYIVPNDLPQVMRDFITNGNNSIQAREDLEILLADYMAELSPKLSSEGFTTLSSLPFDFIIDTNYGNLFFDLLVARGKQPRKGFYDFKGEQVAVSQAGNGSFIYNLYGSIDELRSLVITDFDYIQFLVNIISKSPALPADVRAVLTNEETSILFIGFGMLKKNWYFKILLHALTAGNKKTMSYALEYLSTVNYESDSTVLFFRDELKVCFYNLNETSFIQTLGEKYRPFQERQSQSVERVSIGVNKPEEVRVFISYRREDLENIRKIVARLEENSIQVLWDQSNDFTGDFAKRIEGMIELADAFILMQSASLLNSAVSYVNLEIRLAINRSMFFKKRDSFLYPAYIDSALSRLTDADFDFVNFINNWDLTSLANVDRMAKEIIRNKQRQNKTEII